MTKLSDSQGVILSATAQHEIGLARAPNTLPAAARNAVFRSLIKNNLLTESQAPCEHVGLGWRQDGDGTCTAAACQARRKGAARTAHRLALEVEALRAEGVTSRLGLARALTERGGATPGGGQTWTHTTVARIVERPGT